MNRIICAVLALCLISIAGCSTRTQSGPPVLTEQDIDDILAVAKIGAVEGCRAIADSLKDSEREILSHSLDAAASTIKRDGSLIIGLELSRIKGLDSRIAIIIGTAVERLRARIPQSVEDSVLVRIATEIILGCRTGVSLVPTSV